MSGITTVHSSSLPPRELEALLVECLALNQARERRRLLVMRCGGLALVGAVLETVAPGFSPAARAMSVVLPLVPPVWAWITERRLASSLGQRLGTVGRGNEKS